MANQASVSTLRGGLRQGDPLSPYLFIFCADVLPGLFHRCHKNKQLHGIRIARQARQISHMFFADDSLLFARANLIEAETILNMHSTYQRVSGQVVYVDKSEASYSRNVLTNDKEMICNMMVVKTIESHSRYLGLHVVFGRSSKTIFSLVIDRIWKKMKGWKEKCLSRVDKKILIKVVAQAIPNYIMSCYKLPEGCSDEIDTVLARFWWGSKDGNKKLHRMSWERLSKVKKTGGLGFRSFSDFNRASLGNIVKGFSDINRAFRGKHYQRLLINENSLIGKVFKIRY